MKNPERRSKQSEIILHAARQLFARQGYHGTSTKEIARVADIAENTLFRYFERKEDLFWAALRSSLSGIELRLDLLRAIAEGASPEVVLPQLFTQLMDVTIFKPELLRLIAIAHIELPWKASTVFYECLSPIIATVNQYVAKNIEHGKLRTFNSSLLTTAMIATVVLHPALSNLIASSDMPYSDRKEAIRAYTRFWLEVLTPSGPALFGTIAQTDQPPRD